MTHSQEKNLSLNIGGLYSILSCLHRSDNSAVYKALDTKTKARVILKCTTSEMPVLSQVALFKTEFSLLEQINSPFVSKPKKIDVIGHHFALVFPDDDLRSLYDSFVTRRPTTIEAIEIAIKICHGLCDIHKENLIHCDINPHNILVNKDFQTVKIIDFGMARQTNNIAELQYSESFFEGTPEYMAPEQTGKRPWPNDQRTDLYSLGMTLYWLLSGKSAFNERDLNELLHCHLVVRPKPLHELELQIPFAVSQVVDKLLEKKPEDRYQKSQHLLDDLKTCIEALTSGREIPHLKYLNRNTHLIKSQDHFEIGREKILSELGKITTNDDSQFVIFLGKKGTGKTTLLKKLRFESNRISSFGSFYHHQMGHSSGVWDALRMLTKKLLARQPQEIERWINRLQVSLDPSTSHALHLTLPELAETLRKTGKTWENPQGNNSATAARNIVHKSLSLFFESISVENMKFDFFFDNIHAADQISLDVIQLLLQIPAIKVYTTYNLDCEQPAWTSQSPLLKIHPNTYTFELLHLTLEETEQVTSRMFRGDDDFTKKTSSYIYKMTDGNPEKTSLCLNLLRTKEIIFFDESIQKWMLNSTLLNEFIFEYNPQYDLRAKLETLSSSDFEIVKVACHLGKSFVLGDLLGIVITPPEDLRNNIKQCIEKKIFYLEPKDTILLNLMDNDADLSSPEITQITIYFYHHLDAAFYQSILPIDDSINMSYCIGRKKLWEYRNKTTTSNDVFQVVEHLNKGSSLIRDTSEFIELAQLNFEAASLAFNKGAFDHAANLYKAGIMLLPNGWQDCRKLTWNLYIGLLEASHAAGRHNEFKMSRDNIEMQELSRLEQAHFYHILTRSLAASRLFHDALNQGLKGLANLGISMPKNPHIGHILQEFLRTKKILSSKKISQLPFLPTNTDPECLAIENLLMDLTAPAYFSSPNLFPIIVFKMAQLSAQSGLSPYTPYAFGVYGVLLCAALGDSNLGFQFGQIALNLIKDDHKVTSEMKAKVLTVIYSSISHWKEPLRLAPKNFEKAYEMAAKAGDFEYAAISAVGFCAYGFLSGTRLEQVSRNFKTYQSRLLTLGQPSHIQLLKVIGQSVEKLISQSVEYSRHNSDVFDEQTNHLLHTADKTTTCVFHTFSLYINYLFENDDKAMNHAVQANKLKDAILGTAYLPILHFYESMSILRASPKMPRLQKSKMLAKTYINMQKLRKISKNCPENYLAKFNILQSELDFQKNKDLRVIAHLENCATYAMSQELWQDAALAFERAGNHLNDLGHYRSAATYLKECLNCYNRWGATAKVNQIQEKFSHLLQNAENEGPATSRHRNPAPSISQKSISVEQKRQYDVSTLAQYSKMIFNTTSQDQVFTNILKIMVEHVGAELGMVIFDRDENPENKLTKKNEFYNVAEYQAGKAPQIYNPWIGMSQNHAPFSIFRFALNSNKTIFLKNASKDDLFHDDLYITTKRVKSCLCVPITLQKKVRCILYFEVNTSEVLFSEAEINFVTTLAALLTASLENLKIHQELESRVDARTRELSLAMKEIKETQERIVEVRKQSALSRLVNGIAHEMNTPLGVAVTMLSTIAHRSTDLHSKFQNGITKNQLSDYLEFIARSVEILNQNIKIIANLVDQFKDASIQNRNEHPMVTNLNQLIHTAIESYHLQKPDNRIQFSVNIDPSLNPICFPATLTQILYNLIKNSNTHAFGDKEGTVEINAKSEEDHLSIEFKDNGKGIPQEHISKIFDPFFSTSSSKENMGLGLHIVHLLVSQKLNGQIAVESIPDKGTSFRIVIPHQEFSKRIAA